MFERRTGSVHRARNTESEPVASPVDTLKCVTKKKKKVFYGNRKTTNLLTSSMRVPGALDFFARGCAGEASGLRFDDGCEINENQE